MPAQQQLRPSSSHAPAAAGAEQAGVGQTGRGAGRGNAARAEALGLNACGAGGEVFLADASASLDHALRGCPQAVPRRAGGFEAITSSTGVESSRVDHIVADSESRWNHETLDFTDAARAVADTEHAEDAHPTRSAQLGRDVTPNLRWGLHLACSKFSRPGGDRPGFDPEFDRVAARQADGDFDHSQFVRDPNSGEMRAAIAHSIAGLAGALQGQPGELTVSITTHGGANASGGYVNAADTELVTFAELEALAEEAHRSNIHVVYVVDACLSGDLTQRANESAARDLHDTAASQQAAGENTGVALDRVELATQLLVPLHHLNAIGGQLRMLSRGVAHGGRDVYAALAKKALDLGPNLDDLEGLLHELKFPAAEHAAIAAMHPLLSDAHFGALQALLGTVDDVSAGMHDLAALLDPMNDLVRRLLEEADGDLA